MLNNKVANLCNRRGTFEVKHLLKDFISFLNQKYHFTFLVSRIRYPSPWKQEVQQIMTSVMLSMLLATCCFLSMSFWFSKSCENSFHVSKWGYHGSCMSSRTWKTKGAQTNFTPWDCLSLALEAAVKFGAVPWLLQATASHSYTSQPVKHSGCEGTIAKHTCTILLWFHR